MNLAELQSQSNLEESKEYRAPPPRTRDDVSDKSVTKKEKDMMEVQKLI